MTSYLTKDGKTILIRRPTEKDAENIINYSKILFASTDQVLTTPEEYTISVENEKIWLNNFSQNPDSLIIVAAFKDEITGLLFFAVQPKKKSAHTGEFGVSVHPNFQGIGIGRFLIETLLIWAKENSHIEKVCLQVFATNQKAIALYERMGFAEEGRQVKAIKQLTGEYTDLVQMYIETT